MQTEADRVNMMIVMIAYQTILIYTANQIVRMYVLLLVLGPHVIKKHSAKMLVAAL